MSFLIDFSALVSDFVCKIMKFFRTRRCPGRFGTFIPNKDDSRDSPEGQIQRRCCAVGW